MRPRFFCDSCGAMVGARTDRCPSCGKAFAAVRCPRCGFEGKPWEFARGCALCGYLAPSDRVLRRRDAGRPRRSELSLSRTAARLLGGALFAILVLLVLLVVRG